MMKKRCTKCRQTKPFEAFTKNKNGKYGLAAACRDCRHIKYVMDCQAKGKDIMSKFKPAIGERFRAFLKHDYPGKEHIASPFKRVRNSKKYKGFHVEAKSKTMPGIRWYLAAKEFSFRIVSRPFTP